MADDPDPDDDIVTRIKQSEEFHAAQEALLRQRVEFQPARFPDELETALRFPPRTLLPHNNQKPTETNTSDCSVSNCDSRLSMQRHAEEICRKTLPRSRYLFPPEQLEALLQWQGCAGVGPGLANLGNTCFVNAVLQCLAYTAPLANYCCSRLHSSSCRSTSFCMFCNVEEVIRDLHLGGRRTLSPSGITGRIRAIGRQFRTGRQEDAHEFLLCLLDRLQEMAVSRWSGANNLPAEIAATTEIGQIFGGTLVSQVRCGECGRVSSTSEFFHDLCLELSHAR